jgi:RNA 3'-terminal phosphate cyclase (ATP)
VTYENHSDKEILVTTTPIEIDGSHGEGGGQMLRSALTLSVLSGRPLRMTKIRAGRAKPGLMRQHLTCVKAAAQVSAADVEGGALGSTELHFVPHTIAAGSHHFAIGTAGSTMLVLQTVLPLLLGADAPSRLSLEGGTHNMLAPTADYIEHCFLPVLARMGARVRMAVERLGFYPAGGGRVVIDIEPATLRQIALNERGEARGIRAHAVVAGIPMHVALRELTTVADRFKLRREHIVERDLGSRVGPGNALTVIAHFAGISEVVTALGERRVSAEQVASSACDALQRYLDSPAVVGEHLADQLLLPMLIAGGGEFITDTPSLHLTSNAHVIEAFGAGRVSIEPIIPGERAHRVRVIA